jgi:HAD superfamily hydrolase (TIGR01490 family)
MIQLAVFDLDGTLHDGNILSGFLLHHRLHKVNRLPLYAYVASHSLLIPFWKIGLIPEISMRELWARNLSWAVAGMSKQTGDSCFQWIAGHYVIPLIRPDVYDLVLRHGKEGYRVILVSGTPVPLLEIISRRLGIGEWVGTPLETADGRYTGRIEPPVCQGEGKGTRLKSFLGDAVDSVDWKASFAYADSITDMPLLKMFGRPVAVHPDPKLAAEAKRLNWAILGDLRDPKERNLHEGREKI